MSQDTCTNEAVNATNPQVEHLPATIREGEDEFVASKIATGWPVDRVRVGKVADRPEPKQCPAIVSSREQAINLFFKRSTRTRSHCAMISMVARRSVSRSGYGRVRRPLDWTGAPGCSVAEERQHS